MANESYPQARDASITFFLPSFYDRQRLPPALRRRPAEAECLISQLTYQTVMGRADSHGWIRRKVAYWRRFVPQRRLGPMIRLLTEAGIIETDRRYAPGQHSRAYRLSPPLLAGGFVRQKCDDPRIAGRIRRAWTDLRPTLAVHKHLHAWYRKIEIDADAARHTIDATDFSADHDEYARELSLDAVEKIESGQHTREWSFDRTGRVHTIFTRLPRELRRHIHIDGRSLIGCDVRCAQPLLASLLPLASTLDAQHFATGNSANPYESELPSLTEISTYDDLHIVCESPLSHLSGLSPQKCGSDVLEWIGLSETGTLYDSIVEELRIDRHDARNWIKRQFAVLVNGPCHLAAVGVTGQIASVWRRRWPSTFDAITQLKRKDHLIVSSWLHRAESTTIIGGACEFLRQRFPGVPTLTLHDSIWTTPQHIDMVRDAIMHAFARVGLVPSTKIEGGCSLDSVSVAA